MDGGDQRSIQLNTSCNVMHGLPVYPRSQRPSQAAKAVRVTYTYVISRKPPNRHVLMPTAEA